MNGTEEAEHFGHCRKEIGKKELTAKSFPNAVREQFSVQFCTSVANEYLSVYNK